MRCLAMLVAILLMWSSIAGAAGPGLVGSLRSTGIVLANTVPMLDGSTVRSGDRIACGPASSALITSPGHGRVEVRSDSAALLTADRVELERGVVASSRLPITVAGYTIRPADPDHAWYTVASRRGQLFVAAHQGNVLISSTAGAAPVLLAQGSQAARPAPGQPAATDPSPTPETPTPPPAAQPKSSGHAGAIAGASTGGWTIAGLGHAASVAVVVGAGAAVAGVSVAAVALSDQTPSTSQ